MKTSSFHVISASLAMHWRCMLCLRALLQLYTCSSSRIGHVICAGRNIQRQILRLSDVFIKVLFTVSKFCRLGNLNDEFIASLSILDQEKSDRSMMTKPGSERSLESSLTSVSEASSICWRRFTTWLCSFQQGFVPKRRILSSFAVLSSTTTELFLPYASL
eukprot:IDg20093t1